MRWKYSHLKLVILFYSISDYQSDETIESYPLTLVHAWNIVMMLAVALINIFIKIICMQILHLAIALREFEFNTHLCTTIIIAINTNIYISRNVCLETFI